MFTNPPVIDGYLNDSCWEDATRIDKNFRIYQNFDEPEWGKIAPIKTTVLVGYDDKNLYFGFICEEPRMVEMRVNARWHAVSKEMLEDNRVEILIKPSKDKNNIYCYSVNLKDIHDIPIFWNYITPRTSGCILGIDRHSPFIIPFSERSFSIISDKYSFCNILRAKKILMLNTYLGLITSVRELSSSWFSRVFGYGFSFNFPYVIKKYFLYTITPE